MYPLPPVNIDFLFDCSGKLKVDNSDGFEDISFYLVDNYIIIYTIERSIFMSNLYSNILKKKLCEDICIHKKSTIKTAEDYAIPLKTLEKWITAYNKNPNCFDSNDLIDDFCLIDPINSNELYDDMSNEELKLQLMKKDIEIARLKKGYMVEGGGTEKKVFTTFYKKNMK